MIFFLFVVAQQQKKNARWNKPFDWVTLNTLNADGKIARARYMASTILFCWCNIPFWYVRSSVVVSAFVCSPIHGWNVCRHRITRRKWMKYKEHTNERTNKKKIQRNKYSRSQHQILITCYRILPLNFIRQIVLCKYFHIHISIKIIKRDMNEQKEKNEMKNLVLSAVPSSNGHFIWIKFMRIIYIVSFFFLSSLHLYWLIGVAV